MKRIGTGKSDSGVAALEFGILFPLLVILLLGIIEFSILFFDKAVLTNASREGARAGIVYAYPDPLGDAEITSTVSQYCSDHLVSFGSDSTVSTSVDRGCTLPSGDPCLRVTASYTYQFLVLPKFVLGLTGGINLEAESVMRMEG